MRLAPDRNIVLREGRAIIISHCGAPRATAGHGACAGWDRVVIGAIGVSRQQFEAIVP